MRVHCSIIVGNSTELVGRVVGKICSITSKCTKWLFFLVPSSQAGERWTKLESMLLTTCCTTPTMVIGKWPKVVSFTGLSMQFIRALYLVYCLCLAGLPGLLKPLLLWPTLLPWKIVCNFSGQKVFHFYFLSCLLPWWQNYRWFGPEIVEIFLKNCYTKNSYLWELFYFILRLISWTEKNILLLGINQGGFRDFSGDLFNL